jgi:hypothetical protein
MKKNLLTLSEKHNPNYLSKVIKVDNIITHNSADNLEIICVNGDNVIVRKGSIKIGDVVGFATTESVLNTEFLKTNNQFRDKDLNSDPKIKGYFDKHGRVRAIKLVGEVSNAFIFNLDWLKIWQPEIKDVNWEDYVDVSFDTVNGIEFSKKYIPKAISNQGGGSKTNKRNKFLKDFDRLIENQFNFHYDTAKLQDHLNKISPDDIVSITAKFHGTSVILSNLLVNKELKLYEKILKKLGIKIQDKEYGYIYSSRGVIKNRYINKNVGSGFYATDVWSLWGEKIKNKIPKGYTIYGEICGYEDGTSKFIQKNHDYGCKEGESKLYVYRITFTNEDGLIYEFSAHQVQTWCHKVGLTPVIELYYGRLIDLYPHLDIEQHWHKNLLETLQNDKDHFYMEMKSPHCVNDVPHEGIVIRNDTTEYPALKLKTKAHFLMETKENDEGNIDIEELESTHGNDK